MNEPYLAAKKPLRFLFFDGRNLRPGDLISLRGALFSSYAPWVSHHPRAFWWSTRYA